MSPAGSDVFNPGALEANKDGRLAPDQRRWIRGRAQGSRTLNFFLSAFTAVAGLALVLGPAPGEVGMLWPGGGVALLIVSAVLFVRGSIGAGSTTADMREGAVEYIDGPAWSETEKIGGENPSTNYYVHVGETRLRATAEQEKALRGNPNLRVYYIPNSRQVVNWERLPDLPKAPSMSETDRDALRHALLGRWTDGLETLEFRPDGSLGVAVADRKPLAAKWSLDGHGKLTGDLWGNDHLDVQVGAGGLTLSGSGKPRTYTRSG